MAIALRSLSLEAKERYSADRVLRDIVARLAAQQGVALARIWLLAPANLCPICARRDGASDASMRLHLVASDGRSIDGGEAWQRVDGEFHSIAVGELQIGHVAATGSPILVHRGEPNDLGWPQRPEWVEHEQIASFAAQPLIYRREVIGVIGVFSRRRADDIDLARLRQLADESAVAIVKSHAVDHLDARNRVLEQENGYLREEISGAPGAAGIIGISAALRRVLEQAELVAATKSTVLLCGESGTGKELVARHIHERSPRRERPLIKVNCGSVPHELFESEFFGHVKGAFTGAVKDRMGRFQLAHQGTLFLDEVGEIPLDLQPKLLRALQEGEFERVGDDKTIRVDVRLIAATNRTLLEEVQAGRFREDLYYRLNVFPIVVPPLRERVEDIPLLAEYFAERARRSVGRPQFRLGQEDIQALCEHAWPGNIRELANVIERAAILSPEGRKIDVARLLTPAPSGSAAPALRDDRGPLERGAMQDVLTETAWRELEKQNLSNALRRTHGKLYGPGGAAELLGMKPTTLSSRLRALGLQAKERVV